MRALTPTLALLALLPGCVDYDEAYSRGVEDGLKQLEGRVESLEIQVSAGSGTGLLEEVASQATRIEDLEADNASLETRLAALEAANTDLQSRLSTLETTVANLDVTAVESRVTALETNDATQDGDIDALQTNDTTQDGAIAALQTNDGTQDGAIAALQTNDTTQDSAITALQAADVTHDSDIAAIQADYLTSTDASNLQGQIDANLAALDGKADWIPTDLQLDVPSVYPDLVAALNALDSARISASATVTIQIGPGTHAQPSMVRITHPDADRIHIVGDPVNPQTTVLAFGATHGIAIEDGTTLGLLSGVRLTGDGTTSGTTGLRVAYGSGANVDAVSIADFRYRGVAVEMNSWLGATDDTLVIESCSSNPDTNSVGLWVTESSTVNAQGVWVQSSCYDALYVGRSSYGDVTNGVIDGGPDSGLIVNEGSYAAADGILLQGRGNHGALVVNGSAANMNFATVINNTGNGVLANNMAYVQATGNTRYSNGFGDTSPAAGEGNSNSWLDP